MLFHESAVLDSPTADLLHRLGKCLASRDYVLVGGTALAIQLGHRKSIDLDFFTSQRFSSDEILEIVRYSSPKSQIEVTGKAENTLNLIIDTIKVDLIRYAYPLLREPLEENGYRMLQIADIAPMKLSAISNRGSKKDFFDLHRILQDHSLQELLSLYEQKFEGHDPFFVLRSLTYFDDAENEPDPIIVGDEVSWAEVKAGITHHVKGWGSKHK